MTTTEALRAVASSLLVPLTEPASRTWWPALLATLLLMAILTRREFGRALRHPSTRLDLQLFLGKRLLWALRGGAGLGAAWLVATHSVRALDGWLGAPEAPDWPRWAVTAVYSVVLFVVWDASRFALHWLVHRVPALWAFHQVHHSAEVLTPLTFHRIHPVESVLYELRGVIATGVVTAGFFWVFRDAATDWQLLGVPAIGLGLNLFFGNLRHSHVWLRFPFGLERWFLSPAQHQLHHTPELAHKNLGTWLAIWDRLAGTLVIREAPPRRFGLPDGERNHSDDLVSAWFGPFRALVPLLLLALVAPGVALAEDDDDEDIPDAFGMTMIVEEERGTPRVAGSAHVVGEDDMEALEQDNIERVLEGVPGITTRNEDGFGLRPNIGMRGANSDRSAKVTLMEDGVLFAPAPYAAPAAYYFPMATRLVGVEVFKGPASTRHGPNTVGGAINLRTRAVPEDVDYRLDLAGGLYGSSKVHVYAGASGERAGLLVESVNLQSAGFKELDGGGPTGFERSETMLKAFFEIDEVHRLELKLGWADEVSHETYLGLTTSDLEATPYRRYASSASGLMDWKRTQAELAWSATPSSALQVRTVAYHHYLDRSWTKLNGFEDGPDLHDLFQADPSGGQAAVYLAILRGEEDTTDQVLRVGTNARTFHSFGVQSTAAWTVPGETVSSRLELGARLHGDHVKRLHSEVGHGMKGGELVDLGEGTETTLDSIASAQALAVHAHEDLRIGELHLLPGARLEVVRGTRIDVGEDSPAPTTRATALPGFGVLYGAHDMVDLFAGAYRGFSPVAPGQPDEVRPETSWNYEAGARVVGAERHVELVGFFNDYGNLTGPCTLSGGCTGELVGLDFNGGEVDVYGIEATAGYLVRLPIELQIPLSASYAWTGSRFRTGFSSEFPQFGVVEIGDSLPYVPQHSGALRVTLDHPKGALTVGASGHSGMLDEAGTFPGGDGDIPPLVLVDAGLSVPLGRFTLYGTGSNLTGRSSATSWRPAGARPVAPRSVMVGVKAGP